MTSRLVADDHPMFRDVPRMLGFAALGQLAGLASASVRGYYIKDLTRGGWTLLPPPDLLLMRTEDNPLPGWSADTAGIWLRTRTGSGRTTGVARELDGRRRERDVVGLPR